MGTAWTVSETSNFRIGLITFAFDKLRNFLILILFCFTEIPSFSEISHEAEENATCATVLV
jgi:hypothetical protein